MMVLDLYLVRHGQSVGNLPGVDEYGLAPDDWPLTELGKQQAASLGEHLSSIAFDAIWCSPLERAQATAKAVAVRQPKSIAVKVERDLLEIHACGSSAPEQWHARALRVARALRDNHSPGARVLVVSHGGFNSRLLHALLGLPGLALKCGFLQNNTGLSRVVIHNDDEPDWARVRLHFMNSTTHLSPELIT
ncbi:MAG: histidine phosphatase family protein [Oscillospiraceae bacterium]|nr:histidine phosphatase family protein [Oscillospiraceae bacterium]